MSDSIILLLFSYADIFFLLFSLSLICVIFVKSNKKKEQIVWIGRGLVIPFLLLSSVIELFLIFSSNIQSIYDSSLLKSFSQFVSLLSSIAFLVLIIGKRKIVKFL